MTEEQALELVDSYLARMALNRNEHINLQKAMAVLREASLRKPEGNRK